MSPSCCWKKYVNFDLAISSGKGETFPFSQDTGQIEIIIY